jgi:hypothetical protein
MQKRIAIPTAALFLAVTSGCRKQTNPGNQTADSQQRANQPTSSLPRAVYEVLKANHRPGSLVLQVNCNDSGLVDRRVPVSSTSEGRNLGVELTHLITPEKDLSWRDSEGLVRVTDKSATAGLLSIRLAEFRGSIHEPFQVINALWFRPEVIAYMHDNDLAMIQAPSRIFAPNDSVPPVDLQLQNISVQDVLDRSAIQLKAMWVYMECKSQSKHAVSLDLARF